jgi:hypothetical protein
MFLSKIEPRQRAWKIVKDNRLCDAIFLLLMSLGIMVRSPSNNTEHVEAMQTLIQWVDKREELDVFTAAGLAWVPRQYAPEKFTSKRPRLHPKILKIVETSTQTIKSPQHILASLAGPTISFQTLQMLTSNITFMAVCKLALYCGLKDDIPRILQNRTFLLQVIEKLHPEKALKEMWEKTSAMLKKHKCSPTTLEFLYLLAHVVYSLTGYGVGFDKEDPDFYKPLCAGLEDLLFDFKDWSPMELQVVDEPVAELIMCLLMFSRMADGQKDEHFPVADHVYLLEKRIKKHLQQQGQQGLQAIINAVDKDQIYACVHRTLIDLHGEALATWRESVDVTGTPTNAIISLKRKRAEDNKGKIECAVLNCGENGACNRDIATALNLSSKEACRWLNAELESAHPCIEKVRYDREPKSFGPKPPDRFFIVNK